MSTGWVDGDKRDNEREGGGGKYSGRKRHDGGPSNALKVKLSGANRTKASTVRTIGNQ